LTTARGDRWHYTAVVRMLTRQGLLTWGTGATVNNGQESKRAADARAKALASTIRELQAKGLVSFGAIAHASKEREIPTRLSGNPPGYPSFSRLSDCRSSVCLSLLAPPMDWKMGLGLLVRPPRQLS
jgi:hypothetical protein